MKLIRILALTLIVLVMATVSAASMVVLAMIDQARRRTLDLS